MPVKTSKLTINLPITEHKRLKTAALMMGMSMKDLVIVSFEEFMHRRPNKITEKATKQAETGKGVKKFNSLDDLLKDLGM
jgi:hypothetical protein